MEATLPRRGPYNKDYDILGSVLGSIVWGNDHVRIRV